jgi:hypothetical protein
LKRYIPVLFLRKQVIRLLFHHLVGRFVLTSHRVNRYDTAFQRWFLS